MGTEVGIDVLEQETIPREAVRQLRVKAYSSGEEREALEREAEGLVNAIKRGKDPAKAKEDSLKLGIILWILGRAKEAVEAMEEVKTRKVACYYLGRCYEELGDYERSLELLEKARREDTEELDLELDIVSVQRKAGKTEKALKRIEQLAKSHPPKVDGAEVHYLWGYCMEDMGEYPEAMAHYEKALEINPEHAGSLFRLAYNYDLEGEDDKAIEYYERCKTLSTTYTNVLINLGTLYEDKGEHEKAIACFEAVLRAQPDHPRADLYLKDAKASLYMYYDEEKLKAQTREGEVLNTPISDFELSVRSKNCLERMNIRTLRDLTMVTEEELLSFKNFGETSLSEIKIVLSQKGLRIGQGLEEQKGLYPLTRPREELELIKSPIFVLELSARTLKVLGKIGVQTVEELIAKTEGGLLSNKDIREWHVEEINEKLSRWGLSLRREEEGEGEPE
jgi:DNA-directed RNA polymerase subunit alpha